MVQLAMYYGNTKVGSVLENLLQISDIRGTIYGTLNHNDITMRNSTLMIHLLLEVRAVVLGGLVVSVLAIGHKDRGFIPDRGR
jgi:hypothetical protein